MSSPSAGSRPVTFDIVAAITVAVIAFIASRYLRNHFPGPSGTAWLWVCSVVGVIAAYGIAMKRNMTALLWATTFGAAFLGLQVAFQVLTGLGIIRF